MMSGVSDEYALGMSYGAIDLALDNLSAGVSREDLISAGVTEEEIRRVKEMKELSGWKRRSMTAPLPLDGSRSGGLRVGRAPVPSACPERLSRVPVPSLRGMRGMSKPTFDYEDKASPLTGALRQAPFDKLRERVNSWHDSCIVSNKCKPDEPYRFQGSIHNELSQFGLTSCSRDGRSWLQDAFFKWGCNDLVWRMFNE
jgi:hypothetical protein